eukprot:8351989-Alexandrium_andersonii.AAC.1
MGFQPRLLLVSVMVHLAPRVVESDGAHHITPVLIQNSILAGLTDSVGLTRALLHRTIAGMWHAHHIAAPFTYVDDMAQLAAGAKEDV